VMDNEFAGSIVRIRKGFQADKDTLAVDVVAAVMASTHNYLGQKHTMKALKSGEVFLTKLAERGSWEGWVTSGRVGMVERAQADAERILREHLVPPLDPLQEHELDVIMAAAEKELVK